MLQFHIKGKKNGAYSVELSQNVSTIEFFPEEFIGEVTFHGTFTKLDKTLRVKGKASVEAVLMCDRSAEEYQESISADIDVTFIVNNAKALEQQAQPERESPYYIFEDTYELDLTEEIRQELLLAIPTKKIAPKYRNVEVEDLYPQIFRKEESPQDEEKIDPRWAALAKLKNSQKN